MKHSHLLRATACAAALLLSGAAFAAGVGHGGGHGGGFGGGHGGGHAFGSAGNFHNGGHAFSSAGNVHNGGWNRGGGGWNGGGWNGGGGGWGYSGYPGVVYGYGDAYGYGDPYGYDYGDPDYAYGYDQPDNGYDTGYGPGVYTQQGYQNAPPDSGPQMAAGQLGDYCRSPVKSCQLYQPANVGADCSCRNGETRAQGIVGP